MPRARTNCGRPKTLSCPQCGKKFCSETDVLRHLNQPMSPCYGTSWYQDAPRWLDLEVPPSPARNDSDDLVPDIPPPPNLSDSDPPTFDQPESYEMDVGEEQKFTESFPGCSKSYPGGDTYMDLFWQDEHAEKRRENLYFPFASKEEWAFSSWCLRSGLSMSAIDSLLSLTIVSAQHFPSEPWLIHPDQAPFTFISNREGTSGTNRKSTVWTTMVMPTTGQRGPHQAAGLSILPPSAGLYSIAIESSITFFSHLFRPAQSLDLGFSYLSRIRGLVERRTRMGNPGMFYLRIVINIAFKECPGSTSRRRDSARRCAFFG